MRGDHSDPTRAEPLVKLASPRSLRLLLPVLAALSLASFLLSGLAALAQGKTVPAVISLVIALLWALVLVLFLVEGRRRSRRSDPTSRPRAQR